MASVPTRGESTKVKLFDDFLATHESVRYERHVWQDYNGVLKQRILTTAYCKELYQGNGKYGVGPAAMIEPASGGPEPTPKQELVELVPDWTSLRLCEFASGHAWVMCFVYLGEEESDPLYQCPRYLLSQVLDKGKEEGGLSFTLGSEIEFVLLNEPFEAITDALDTAEQWSAVGGLRDGKLKLLEEIVQLLQASSIGVTHFHTEGQHQFGISTSPSDPMSYMDALLYTQELVRCVAIRHGYRATMAYRPLHPLPITSACQLHFSLPKDSGVEDHFLAGIMKSLPSITPFAMPTFDSYQRDAIHRGGIWICWGTQNRDVPVRKINKSHWEFRLSDATANVYMLTAVLLYAGLEGVRRRLPLKQQDIRLFPSKTAIADLEALGIHEKLPRSLIESLEYLKRSSDFDDLLNARMKQIYICAKEADYQAFAAMSDEERRKQYIKLF